MEIISTIRRKTYRFRRNTVKTILSLYNWRDKLPYLVGLKKVSADMMPNFIIAGLPKCGTVWLVDVLKQHPKFNYVENPFYKHKHEIRFFSFNFDKPIKDYFKTFKKQDPNLISFEKSPDYSVMSKTRIRLIKKLKPNIKIILIFRDPVERAFSNAKMDLIRKRNIELRPENDYLFYKHYDSQLRRYDYKKILEKWWRIFPKEQILILSLEDIKANPSEVLNRVYSFFDIRKPSNASNFELTEAKNVTKAKSIPETHKKYIREQIPEIIEYWNENSKLFRLQ